MSENKCNHTTPNCGCKHKDLNLDELGQLEKIDKNQAFERFEQVQEDLKNEVKSIEVVGKKAMVHLHLHTFHSILDGCGSIDNYIKLAKQYGHPAIGITDHGTMSGTFEFYQKCKKA